MKFLVFVVTGSALSLFCASAHGQTQRDLNDKAKASFETADAKLNLTYKTLRSKLDDEGVKKLQDAEKAWIKFRDAEAESQADDYRGGSIVPLIYYDCLTALTETRTTQLEARIKDLDGR